MKQIQLLGVGLGLIMIAAASGSSYAADRVGSIVVKDERIRGICLLPIGGCPQPDPGVIRGIVNLLGEEKAEELGIKKRFLTRRTYKFPVVTNDEICAKAKQWLKQYRKDGRPKLWNDEREMSFEVAPALVSAIASTGYSYYKGIGGVFVGDPDVWGDGSNVVLSVRPDRVKTVRGLCD